MVNAHCITTTPMQKVKGQGYTRPKVDLQAWHRHHSRPPWVNQLFYCGFLSHTIKVVKATEQWTSLLLLECHFRGGALWMHIMPNILLNTGMARQLAIEHL